VRFRDEGRTVLVPAGRSILEAATAQGLALAHSCTVGGCGTCRLRLVSGQVAMDEPNCLSAEERALGLVLVCVGRPLGPVELARP